MSFSATTDPRRQAPSAVISDLGLRVVDPVAQRRGREAAEHDGVRGADARAREERDRELGHHPHVDGDAITLGDAQ